MVSAIPNHRLSPGYLGVPSSDPIQHSNQVQTFEGQRHTLPLWQDSHPVVGLGDTVLWSVPRPINEIPVLHFGEGDEAPPYLPKGCQVQLIQGRNLKKELGDDEFAALMNLMKAAFGQDLYEIPDYDKTLSAMPGRSKAIYITTERDNTPIAFGKLNEFRQLGVVPRWYITDLAVDPKYRRRKIGRYVVKQLIDQANQMNVRDIYLHYNPENKKAGKIYRDNGFIQVSEQVGPDGKLYWLMKRNNPHYMPWWNIIGRLIRWLKSKLQWLKVRFKVNQEPSKDKENAHRLVLLSA